MTDQKKMVLYVDDEPNNLLLFEAAFRKNYHVITADSGKAGLAKLDEMPEIELVISDMKMPDMSGIAFVKEARKENQNKFFFILSGFDFNEEIEAALEEKIIDRSFKKPFSLEEIQETMDSYLSNRTDIND